MAILFGCIKELLRKKKYLRSIFSSHVFLENGQNFLSKLFKKVNSDISTFGLCSTYIKANCQAFNKMEMMTSSKKTYKACQVR